MHTFSEGDYVILHDGDYQGEVIIRDNKEPFGEVVVPAALLRGFVAKQIRQNKISKLEQLSDNEVLGLR